MDRMTLPVVRSFGETRRRDLWWVQPGSVVLVFAIVHRLLDVGGVSERTLHVGNYLSPFYSPAIFSDRDESRFEGQGRQTTGRRTKRATPFSAPKPGWWPAWLIFSPALLILWAPGGFRFTCYYYRGAYYKAFWADPPACAVGEPRKSYCGEQPLPARSCRTSIATSCTSRCSSSVVLAIDVLQGVLVQ